MAGFCVTAFRLCPAKEKCGETKKHCLSPCSHPHHGHSASPILWPLTKAHRRSRYRYYFQWCRICPLRSWPSPSNPIRYKAIASPDLDPMTNRNEQVADTSTIRIPGQQKCPLCCITITRETSVASRTESISRIATSFSG